MKETLSEIDHQKDRNWFIWIIIIISLITYLFHNEIDKYLGLEYWFWFKGQALFIWLMSGYLLSLVKKKSVAFILFGYATNNLFDELFFNPVGIGLNEYIFAILIPLIALIIWNRHDKRIR